MHDSPKSLDAVKAFFNRPEHFARTTYRSAVRGAIVREILGPVQQARILDLGCGDGGVSIPLLGATNEVTLVDFAPRTLEVAAQKVPSHLRSRVSLALSPVDEFRPSAPFDVVLCLGVLAHVPSIEVTVSKIVECLKPGGSAIVELTPDALGWKRRLFAYRVLAQAMKTTRGYRLNRMLPDEFVALAASKGLVLRSVRRHSVPLPGMAWWPGNWQYRYALLSWRNSFLSRFGVEHVHCFTKA